MRPRRSMEGSESQTPARQRTRRCRSARRPSACGRARPPSPTQRVRPGGNGSRLRLARGCGGRRARSWRLYGRRRLSNILSLHPRGCRRNTGLVKLEGRGRRQTRTRMRTRGLRPAFWRGRRRGGPASPPRGRGGRGGRSQARCRHPSDLEGGKEGVGRTTDWGVEVPPPACAVRETSTMTACLSVSAARVTGGWRVEGGR